MTTPTLDDFVCVPIPLDLYAELGRRQPRGVADSTYCITSKRRTASPRAGTPTASNGRNSA